MLAPDKSVVSQFLTNFLSSYQSVSLAAISLRNSQFFPLTPAPDWMQVLDTNLNLAQASANDFLTSQGPTIITQVPQFFVTYANSVQVVANNIGNSVTVQDAIQQLNWLKNHIDDIPTAVKILSSSLNTVSTTFKPYKDKIDLAMKSALADIKTDQADALKISNQISVLFQDISAETVKAANGMTGVISSGASMSVALLSWSFAVATTLNPALPIIGVLVAVGGLTYGAITNAINESKIAANLEAIKTLSASLLEENQSIIALQTLTPMLQSVENCLSGIIQSMDVSAIWQAESQKVSDLIESLQNYTGSNFKSIPDIASLSDAASTWKILAQWATNIQKATTGMTEVGEIKLDETPSLKLV